jgi:DNA-binding LacI/PurR family transcriptional regulator
MAESPPRRITQKEVAKEAGVSHVTVSLALRGHRGIPASTRERIEAIAGRMGYTPDPMLKALSSYRRSQKPPAFQATLGWINTWPQAPEVGISEDFQLYFQSAKARAKELGFGVDVFNLADYGFGRRAIQLVLASRNISGLLVGPLQNPLAHIDLDWSRYSAVRIGYSMLDTVLHTVMNSQYRSAYMAVENLFRLGYRRVGYASHNDQRCGGHFLGGYLSACRSLGLEALPVLDVDPDAHRQEDARRPHQVRSWLKSVKPEAVVAPDYWIPDFERWGYSVPGDLGVASLAVTASMPAISGMNQNPCGVGRAAVDLLVSLMERRETGVPATPMHLLVDGWWNAGTTVRVIQRSPGQTSARRSAKMRK